MRESGTISAGCICKRPSSMGVSWAAACGSGPSGMMLRWTLRSLERSARPVGMLGAHQGGLCPSARRLTSQEPQAGSMRSPVAIYGGLPGHRPTRANTPTGGSPHDGRIVIVVAAEALQILPQPAPWIERAGKISITDTQRYDRWCARGVWVTGKETHMWINVWAEKHLP